MGLENVQNLKELNQILNDSAAAGYKNIIKTKWGTRDFELISSKSKDPICVKMSEIIDTFARLAETDPDKHLIGSIHDRIFELNQKGEKYLGKEGFGAVLLRNIKTLFSKSHSTRNDNIELKHLSEESKKLAQDILKEFNDLQAGINKLAQGPQEHDHNYRDRAKQITDARIEYSNDILRKIFRECNGAESAKSEETKDAIRYIAHNNPKKALDILYHLQCSLDSMSQHPVNPKEFIHSLKQFFEVQEKEIFAATKLSQKIEAHGSASREEITEVNIFPDPTANFKLNYHKINFIFTLDEKTKKPELRFETDNFGELMKKFSSDIDKASKYSIYGKPTATLTSRLNESKTEKGKFNLGLDNDSAALLSGMSKEKFTEELYKTMWKENKIELSQILEGIIANLSESQIEDFLVSNDIGLDSNYFINTPALSETLNTRFPELMKKIELKLMKKFELINGMKHLINGMKNFSIENLSPSNMRVIDYINDKSRTTPVEDKLSLFIQHANREAMEQLLASFWPHTHMLDASIKTGPDTSATPLAIAYQKGKKELFKALYEAGARDCIVQEGTTTTKHSVEYLLNNKW